MSGDIDWDCWIGDEAGNNKIYFEDEEQPSSIPLPVRDWQGSLHDLVAAGAHALQSSGYGPGVLPVSLRIPYDKWLLLEALLTRVQDGEHKQVQFNNSYTTYLCTSIGQLKPDFPNKRPPRVLISLQLLVESEV